MQQVSGTQGKGLTVVSSYGSREDAVKQPQKCAGGGEGLRDCNPGDTQLTYVECVLHTASQAGELAYKGKSHRVM